MGWLDGSWRRLWLVHALYHSLVAFGIGLVDHGVERTGDAALVGKNVFGANSFVVDVPYHRGGFAWLGGMAN